MKKLFKLVMKLAMVAVGLFVGTFTIYILNLDMKLLAYLEPYMDKIYDLRKDRNPRV